MISFAHVVSMATSRVATMRRQLNQGPECAPLPHHCHTTATPLSQNCHFTAVGILMTVSVWLVNHCSNRDQLDPLHLQQIQRGFSIEQMNLRGAESSLIRNKELVSVLCKLIWISQYDLLLKTCRHITEAQRRDRNGRMVNLATVLFPGFLLRH